MKTRWHLLAAALLGAFTGLLFLREPGFGDDLNYWAFAFDLHEQGLSAWKRGSFHDLRWPVWGVSWLLQAIFGPGLAAYYGVPMLYLGAGAALSFTFGNRLLGSMAAAWACSIAFIFHPLLDTVVYRPMPDLSEGVWGAVAILLWWLMVQAQTARARLGFSLLIGAVVFIIESNRLTGVFIVPVLVVCTLLFFPRRFVWLFPAGAAALALYGLEAAFYHQLFGDWLHSIHANLGARGRPGTESIALWYLPFRFLDALWKGNPLSPAYCILALIGIWQAWRRHGVLGRVVVVWFVTLYLQYSCAPQSLWPWRPLLRDADRFLCGLAVPMSLLAAMGLCAVFQLRRIHESAATNRLRRYPMAAGAVAILLLAVITSRELFNPGSVPEFRRYTAALPDGAKIFSHKSMRGYAYLVDSDGARRFDWTAPRAILHSTPELEAAAAQSDEFWYARKLVWLTTRKKMQRGAIESQPVLASYFDHPESDWILARLLAKGDAPDLIFYRRRTPDAPPPIILGADAPVWGGLLKLPAEWRAETHERRITVHWTPPPELRGKLARVELVAESESVQAVQVRLLFRSGRKIVTDYLLKPYLYPEPSKEFFALEIPAAADSCEVRVQFSKDAKWVKFHEFRAVIETAAAPDRQ